LARQKFAGVATSAQSSEQTSGVGPGKSHRIQEKIIKKSKDEIGEKKNDPTRGIT
jgi:hypothetical protein